MRVFLAAALGLSVAMIAHAATSEPLDVIVYGSHVPSFKWSGPAFVNPFTQQEAATDPITRIGVTPVPGLARPLGTVGWGAITWAKYYLVAAYDEGGAGIGQKVEDQRVGIFDTENHAYCQLDLAPSLVANAGVEFLAVANPSSRQSRIFFQGFLGGTPTTGFAFGYIEGDLDNDTPCDPVNGWHVVGFDGDDLNAAATLAGLPSQKQPCGTIGCGLDGVGAVDHEASGRDTIVLNNWFEGRIIMAQIDAAGTLTVPDVYVLPSWKPVDTDGACYQLRPVSRPIVDPTRATGDKRFLYSFDPSCDPPVDTQSCTYNGLCPLTGSACALGTDCSQSSCARPLALPGLEPTYLSCTTTANCQYVLRTCVAGPNVGVLCSNDLGCPGSTCGPGLDLGACTIGCRAVNPQQVCSSNIAQTCMQPKNCPGWTQGGAANPTCDCKLPGQPAQEYRFDGTTLAPVSGYFQAAIGHTAEALTYDNDGALWARDGVRDTLPASAAKGPVIYAKQAGGEHAYYDPAAAGQSVIVPENTVVGFSHDTTLSWLDQVIDSASRAVAHPDGGAVYLAGRKSIQRGVLVSGSWLRDPGYKTMLGSFILPHEPGRCFAGDSIGAGCAADADCPGAGMCTTDHPGRCKAGTNAGSGCTSNADCPGSTCAAQKRCNGGTNVNLPCTANAECPGAKCEFNEFAVGLSFAGALDIGGSPPSLWTTPDLGDGYRKHGALNSYLIRTPVSSALPDNQSATRPGATWSGARLWLVSEHGGSRQYRIRDDGQWSGWYPLPANVGLAGGVAITSNGTGLQLYARGAGDGLVYTSSLTSVISCGAGSCQWSAWTAIPGSPVTDAEPAATYRGAQNPLVAVRQASDGKIFFSTQNASGGWSTWAVAKTTFVSATGPGAAYHMSQDKVWLIARELSTGSIKSCSIGSTVSAWSAVGGTGGPATWGYTPAIQYDGTSMRAFAQATPYPEYVYQASNNGTGWSKWRPLASGTISTTQPAAANVNGEIELVTKWYLEGLRQQGLK